MHRVLALFLLFAFIQPAKAAPPPIDSLIAFSKKQLGVPYKWAQSSPKNGFDCSGFVYYVFSHFNIAVPRASMEYERTGKPVSADSCRAGDIIIFTGTDPRIRRAGHVGIVLSASEGDIRFIHASSGHKKNGVIISSLKETPSYRKRLIKIVRLNPLAEA